MITAQISLHSSISSRWASDDAIESHGRASPLSHDDFRPVLRILPLGNTQETARADVDVGGNPLRPVFVRCSRRKTCRPPSKRFSRSALWPSLPLVPVSPSPHRRRPSWKSRSTTSTEFQAPLGAPLCYFAGQKLGLRTFLQECQAFLSLVPSGKVVYSGDRLRATEGTVLCEPFHSRPPFLPVFWCSVPARRADPNPSGPSRSSTSTAMSSADVSRTDTRERLLRHLQVCHFVTRRVVLDKQMLAQQTMLFVFRSVRAMTITTVIVVSRPGRATKSSSLDTGMAAPVGRLRPC